MSINQSSTSKAKNASSASRSNEDLMNGFLGVILGKRRAPSPHRSLRMQTGEPKRISLNTLLNDFILVILSKKVHAIQPIEYDVDVDNEGDSNSLPMNVINSTSKSNTIRKQRCPKSNKVKFTTQR
ncbi:predicted protein [Thalassiosira pseudonana CCMP1335]|uniref:Uncharacterized protein n=1 Tax=Thalassiosira pseudonana TaxID=35128 RepID=B8C3S7_THAPS|nr:predicted protein [Thalassiosira pseudonana CCMP1335]EED92175.1 predicted protein [Thalassiosira pseudonana CCMP1335]